MTPDSDLETPAKKIRNALGISQWKMGELLGVSRDAVEKVENRRMPMPRDLAYRYRSKTGCDIREGQSRRSQREGRAGARAMSDRGSREGRAAAEEGPIEIVATYLGKPYTRHEYDEFRHSFGQTGHIADLEEMMRLQIQDLMQRADRKGKVMEFVGDFCRFLSETILTQEMSDDLGELFANPYAVMQRDFRKDSHRRQINRG